MKLAIELSDIMASSKPAHMAAFLKVGVKWFETEGGVVLGSRSSVAAIVQIVQC